MAQGWYIGMDNLTATAEMRPENVILILLDSRLRLRHLPPQPLPRIYLP